ncbi:hypothetical protein GH714_037837 [Hevea brasiliensis]|uniref:Uncharacterized protein n=1 Tax=Hevea brasiliensis TaxID=3981 RepID=A0A6A6LWL1_HEVBR|nr:hypothetical protein GH714_037837 [Hevea brasiliensis]
MESEGKLGPAMLSSWADEVEKEDEEKARAQVQQKEKPNPFGSARPREVVLQEKGIDWRKLDLHLEQQASLVRQEPLSEKCKENIPASSLSVINRVQSEPPRKGLKDANLGFNLLAAPNQVIVVPPLRYPPRNIAASLSKSRISYMNLYDLENGQHGFQYGSNLKTEKNHATGRSGTQMVHCHKKRLHIEQGRQFMKNGIKFESGQSMGKNKNLSKPVAHCNGQHSDYDHPRRKFDGSEQNMMTSLLGTHPIQDRMRLLPSERAWKSVKDNPAVKEATKPHLTSRSCTRRRNIEHKIWSQRTSCKERTVSQEDSRSGMERSAAEGKQQKLNS